MNSALTTAAASMARVVGLRALACGAPSWIALAHKVAPVHAAHAATAATTLTSNDSPIGMYGDPAAAAPFWRPQHSSDCGEMAVADVVGQITGREPTERQITSIAKITASSTDAGPIYHRRDGTDVRDLPVLLAHYGVQSSLLQANIEGLEQYLAQRHKVIAAVNAQRIWNTAGNRDIDNHVVVVTGIDTRIGVVHLNDSGITTGRDEQVALAAFEKSWATSQHLAVVTT